MPKLKVIKIKKLGEYYDFSVQGNTLFSADVFKNFQNMCLKIMCQIMCL